MQQRITTDVSHLAQIRKQPNLHLNTNNPKLVSAIREALGAAEHYVFTSIPESSEAIAKSVTAMQRANVWRLPHKICTFEYTASLSIEQRPAFSGVAFRVISLCFDGDDGPGVVATFIRAKPGDAHSWRGILHRPGEDATGFDPDWDAKFGAEYTKAYTAGVELALQFRPASIDLEHNGQDEGGTRNVGELLSGCMVALATRGIRRERWIGDKKVLVGRKEPSNAYTRVMVAEAATGQGGHSLPGERHKVRLHLREGHIRNQPHGPGRRFVRAIFIEPTLVGYVEEGTITHTHHEVYPHEEHA